MWILWVLVVIISVIIAITIYRRYGRRLTERQIIASQQIVNKGLTYALGDLGDALYLNSDKYISSTLVANIWGHEVMAFEFVLPVSGVQEVVVVRQAVNNALREYAEKNNLQSASETDMALLVTDVWYDTRIPELHIDIAHIINQETAAYIRDLRKLNQPV
ncbi:hypothetical protein [Weissella thailandensis]|uniref:Uncharacterized protein n=1 Tax=Weissella thailandensis TaxID=89061 RepID=A0ABX9I566_9LACO|nr:hypothetical protein [Weissella thailandensis]NKY89978.1 hypothetical protein [Weissella thailandensis]RDS59727.1 hypothetical protein DWV05_03990 [Weissella thailandensis]GEP74211.1 hypothetical protein WTH01_04580 [Weissella thailandensis]